MKKMSTLFEIDYISNKRGDILDKVKEENSWVYKEDGVLATRKFDGTACMIFNNKIYRRYDAKINKLTGEYKRAIPGVAIPCQEADRVTGHHPHWLLCSIDNTSDKFHIEALNKQAPLIDGTYELCGEKIGINSEKIEGRKLIKHGSELCNLKDFTFKTINDYLEEHDIEGIVFYGADNKMCKIRKNDFGIKR